MVIYISRRRSGSLCFNICSGIILYELLGVADTRLMSACHRGSVVSVRLYGVLFVQRCSSDLYAFVSG